MEPSTVTGVLLIGMNVTCRNCTRMYTKGDRGPDFLTQFVNICVIMYLYIYSMKIFYKYSLYALFCGKFLIWFNAFMGKFEVVMFGKSYAPRVQIGIINFF